MPKVIKDKSKKKITSAAPKPNAIAEEEIIFQTPASLMPELEELVKKNPNRLLGCGG